MYFDYAVAIPLEKGKIITKKKGNATYILYQYGQIYKPEKNMQFLSGLLSERLIRMPQIQCIPMNAFRSSFLLSYCQRNCLRPIAAVPCG